MHIRSVTAEAFGPLVNETLTLSPGLTIVHGDNESAKSSWHAAIYAALCGRRRGRGANKLDDREFADRRRPWDRNSWKVRCEVRLDDGRTVTLRHDLDGKVDCCAVDERGRDVSSEIMYDGAPDGSRWLGLNRRTFAATACVNQAELLRVLEAAGDLQTDIQRAAATAGKDETAASALDAVKKYCSDQVGLDRVNSRKPLRRAVDEHQRATSAYEQAQRAHDDYLRLVVDSDRAQQAAAAAAAERRAAAAARESAERVVQVAASVASAQAAAAQAAALADERRANADARGAGLTTARVLSASLPAAEPTSRHEDDATAQQVAGAIGAWRSAPVGARLGGPTSHELQKQIDGLPLFPDGDLEVDPSVEHLRDEYLQARAVVRRSERERVERPEVSDPFLEAALAADPAALPWLAERLSSPIAAADSQLQADLDAAQRALEVAATVAAEAEQQESAAFEEARRDSGQIGFAPSQHAATQHSATQHSANQHSATQHSATQHSAVAALTAGLGTVLLAVAVVLLVLGHPLVGAVLAAVGLGALSTGLAVRRSTGRAGNRAPTPPTEVDERLEAARAQVRLGRDESMRAERGYLDAKARLESASGAAALSAARRQAAAAEAAELGLPDDASQLMTLAARGQRLRAQREAFELWQRGHESDELALRSSHQRFVEALNGRGYPGQVDTLAAYSAYEQDCIARRQQAQQARRRNDLDRQLADRLESERAAQRARQVRDAALYQLRQAAQAVGLCSAESATATSTATSTAIDADALAEELAKWLSVRAATLEGSDVQRKRWHQLQTVLDGRSLDQLEAEAASLVEAAAAADQAAGLAAARFEADTRALQEASVAAAAPYPLEQGVASALLEARSEDLEHAADEERELARVASSQLGKVAERERAIPDVAEAEEAVERVFRELERVRSLGQVLDLTESFLKQAQETTYTNLAPVLNAALDKWLPEITGGRYRHARVDPETLAVRVESETGALRRAELLSVGTAEQVYLLLRVALAEHLASRSTVSPLLLDDVTVQADPTRTEAILHMCKALADAGRQVVLFAQEPSVAAWAQAHLDGTQHTLVRLTVPTAA